MPTPLEQVKTAILQNYIFVSTLNIVIYEHIFLFRSEIDSIWRRRVSIVTILFFVNRYTILVYAVLGFTGIFTLQSESCTVVTRFNEAVTILLFVVCATFPALRIYAIWGKKVSLGLLVFGLLAVPAAANIFLYTTVKPTVLISPATVCILTEYHVHVITKVVIASRTISIFADALVLILTCVKTLRTYLMAREVRLTQKNSISELLVRQGIVYFLIFLSLNVAQTAVQETTGIEYLSPYIFAVTSILMTRFMLNLRKVDDQPSYSLSSALDDVTFEHPQSYPVGESGEVDRETMFCEPSRRTPGFMEGMDADLEFTEMEAEESSLVD